MANCIIRTRCGNCGKTWDVYYMNIRDKNANICPYCKSEVDRVLWDNEVFRAAATTQDANCELEKMTGWGKPRFSVNLINRKA